MTRITNVPTSVTGSLYDYCSECGATNLKPDWKFCPYCGASLEDFVTTAAIY